jgi:four helix bundle protein
MYRVAGELPEVEKFGLANQVRRAALSLTNNIAEGHGRFHFLDQIKFTLQARGSLEELIDDLNVCLDEQYLFPDKVDMLKADGWRVRQLIDGYIRYLRIQSGQGSRAKEEPFESSIDEVPDPIHDPRFTIHPLNQ